VVSEMRAGLEAPIDRTRKLRRYGGGGRNGPSERDLMGCEIRARPAGFGRMWSPQWPSCVRQSDLGTIILHRLGNGRA